VTTGGLNIQDFVSIEELMSFLGYSDFRSAFSWCKRYSITVLKVGLKKYVKASEISELIENQLINFEEGRADTRKLPERKPKFQAQNEIVSKYLSKYEKQSQFKTSKKG
jgi:cell shape-determining protein MreC